MAYLDQFLQIVVRQEASDLHIAEGEPPKIRMHGDIMPIRAEPISHDEARRMLSEVCGPRNWELFEQHGDLDFAYQMDEHSRFRTNYFKQSEGYAAAFRLIPTKISTLEELGIPAVVKEFAYLRGGLVLVTGPTGSGKTTTQAALVDFINENFARHVVTIEEPIEFVHDNKRSIITQREVPADSNSFAAGLKASLRQDTDIVLVGEMRDLETISLALTRSRNRPSRVRHSAYKQRAQNRGSHGGCFPRRSTTTGARDAGKLTSWRGSAIAFEKIGSSRAHCRERNSDRESLRSLRSSAKAPRTSCRI